MSVPKLPELPEAPQLPALPILPRPPWEQEPTLTPKIPGIAGGVVTAPSKGWQLVEYTDISNAQKTRFSAKPLVLALAEVRFGEILDVPYRTIPALPLTVYRCTKNVGWWILASDCGWMKIAINPDFVPDWFKPYIPDVLKPPHECPQGHGSENIQRMDDYGLAIQGFAIYWTRELIDWNITIPIWPYPSVGFNFIRDALLKGLYWAYYGIGRAIGYIAAQLPVMMLMIQSSVNAALNDVLPTFWNTTGLPKGQLITPVNTQNVTTTSFEYYALSKGQKTHYIAIGIP